MGHIVHKSEPLGAFQTYTYYPDGKLRTTTDSDGNTTTIGYDNLGHRKSLDDPDMGVWSYRYNAAGELVYKKDANGVITTIEYDKLGRKTKQTEGGAVSTWTYDDRGAPGTLSSHSGYGSTTNYYYNNSGLTQEVAVETNGEKFSTHYFYDQYERVSREVRPNGIDSTTQGLVNLLSESENYQDRLAVEYVFNDNGYVSAVRSPKTYADDVFASASFREEIQALIDQATSLAKQYLTRAERYAAQETFFTEKASEYNAKTISIHQLDASSLALLADGYRYKQWCNAQKICYLRPGTWVLLHDDVSIPLDITLDGTIMRLETNESNYSGGVRSFDATVHEVTEHDFNAEILEKAHDFILTDYDGDGKKDLMSQNDIYVAKAEGTLHEELLFTADDLDTAATIAGTRYKYYTELAEQLITLSEEVAKLSGIYCNSANQLAGGTIDGDRSVGGQCSNDRTATQVRLNTCKK